MTGGADVHSFFARLGIALPDRGTGNVQVRCFANPEAHKNEDRRPSCSVSLEDGAWLCYACGARGGAYEAAIACGCTPRAAMDLKRQFGLPVRERNGTRPAAACSQPQPTRSAPAPAAPSRPQLDVPTDEQISEWRDALLSDDRIVARLHELRGWTRDAITATGIGLEHGRIVFLIRDATGAVCGVERYQPNGELCGPHRPKLVAQRGGKRDLWPAPETFPPGSTVLLVEGRPDAVAGQSLGFRTVSVAGSETWRPERARRFTGLHVVVIPDCDGPGRKLAAELARDLPAHAASVRVLELDPLRTNGHDLGDLLREAAASCALEPAAALIARTIRRLPPLPRPGQDTAAEAVLDQLPAAVGVPLLIGRPAPPYGTARCPLCDQGQLLEPTNEQPVAPPDAPGLRVAPVGIPGHQGWWCGSCRKSGRLTDLGAQLWGLNPIRDRGEVQRRCLAVLHEAAAKEAKAA